MSQGSASAAKVALSVGSNQSGFATPAFSLSHTMLFGTPPKKDSASHCPAIQSGRRRVRLAVAKVQDEAPGTATKICAS